MAGSGPILGAAESPAWFDEFAHVEGVRLRQALIARFGLDDGCDVYADAMAWAWEHRDEVASMRNPVGYLYRVGQSAMRLHTRWSQHVVLVERDRVEAPREPDVDLVDALTRLRHEQRIAVVLVHAHGWSYTEVADVLDVSVAAVTNHVHRGLQKLRARLEER